MDSINFQKIEKKWQKKWEESKAFEVNENSKKPKYYVLEMFPYPSGSGLHMGHAWNYTIGDIIARFKRMKGFNVLHPMGYDSLGLPAENAAIKDGIHPEEYTKKSIKNYIRQQKELGLSYDWSRVISTANPDYYLWDQWIFLKMFEKGLAYQKESNVNWCPSCKTVLANEQAQNGHCDRCGTKVEIKHLKQWFLKITNYANELYENLDNMDWPNRTKAMQRNWIGKSHGAEVDFLVNNSKWPIFTTRLDTIFGVTFLVVSAQHKKLWDLVTPEHKKDVEEFLKKLKSVSEKNMADMEKEGVFTGSYAVNPATNEKIPIYAGNFVVADYGSGMVMAVPAHDQRDFLFAKKYGLQIKQVIEGNVTKEKAYAAQGNLINSGDFNGLNSEEAKKKILLWLEKKGLARNVVNFRLRDWGISRQRYWGTPIPIVHCPKCGAVQVPEKDLPVTLPKKIKFGEGNPLETNEEWINVNCPVCGGPARRETDTMDTFVNSSWYFLRYCDPKNNKEIFDKKKIEYWSPVDTYIGGAEHACMHLIYSRFYVKFLRDLGLLKFNEPALKLFHQGMLHAQDGSKMSKSKANGVLPETVSKKYGIDTARFFLSSLASPDKDINWSDKGIIGSLRFINKIFDFSFSFKNKEDSKYLLEKLNLAIKNIEKDYEEFEYRKATIELRGLFDLIYEEGCSKKIYEAFLKLISPITPHLSEELWEKLGHKDFISLSSWPDYDKNKLKHSKKKIDLNKKTVDNIKEIILRLEEKGRNISKVYVYVLPFELNSLDVSLLEEGTGRKVKIYSVVDKKMYDPENKSKKARPGMPGLYFE